MQSTDHVLKEARAELIKARRNVGGAWRLMMEMELFLLAQARSKNE